MRIISMHFLLWNEAKPYFLKSSFELGFVNFLQRMFAKDPLIFAARTVIGRMKPNNTLSVELEDMDGCLLYAHVMKNNLTFAITTDKEYPEAVVKKIMSEMLREFQQVYNMNDIHKQINDIKNDINLKFDLMDKKLQNYQNPKEADKFLKLEGELDEIKEMLHKTMKDLLERGEQLDDLVKKSDDLSNMSKGFYDKCKKANTKCCSLY